MSIMLKNDTVHGNTKPKASHKRKKRENNCVQIISSHVATFCIYLYSLKRLLDEGKLERSIAYTVAIDVYFIAYI